MHFVCLLQFRHRRGSGGYLSPEKDAKTSNIPFLAIVSGQQSIDDLVRELKWSNVLIAATGGALFAFRRLVR